MARRPPPDDPLRVRARDSGPADAWHGARTAARAREQAQREHRRIPAEIDIGEPHATAVTALMLFGAAAATLASFGRHGASPTAAELAQAGGVHLEAFAVGDWWKLLAANLLHSGPVHLMLNLFVIALVGRWLEHLAGRLLTAATIAWSAVAAAAAALVVNPGTVTVGASGVAFGLVGAALAIDPRGRTAAGQIARPLAVVNVIGTFIVPGISIAGHLGGLVAGLAVGLAGWRRRATPQAPAGAARPVVRWLIAGLAVGPIALLAAGPAALPQRVAWREQAVAPLLERQLSQSGAEWSCTARPDPRTWRCSGEGGVTDVRFGDDGDDTLHSPRSS